LILFFYFVRHGIGANVLQLPEERQISVMYVPLLRVGAVTRSPIPTVVPHNFKEMVFVFTNTVQLDCKLFLFFEALAICSLRKIKSACNLGWKIIVELSIFLMIGIISLQTYLSVKWHFDCQ
jgi:hypothetical protein